MNTSATAVACHRDNDLPFWRLWTVCLLGYFAIGSTIAVVPAYVRQQLHGDAFIAGMIVTVGFLATMVTRPFAGRMADEGKGLWMLRGGALLAALGGIGHMLAPTSGSLVVARLCLGCGEGALFTAAIGMVLASTPAEQRGRIAGRFGLSMWGGLTGGPIVGVLLQSASGFRGVWIVASVLPLISCALLFGPGAAHLRTGKQSAQRRVEPRRRIPRSTLLLGSSYAFASLGYGAFAACAAMRFAVLSVPGSQQLLAAFGALFLLTRLIGSPLVDRYGAARMLMIALSMETAGMAGLSVAHDLPTAVIATAVASVGLSLVYPCYIALVTGATLASERVAAVGVVISAWDLGVALGGPLAGLLAMHAYTYAFQVSALACVVSMLVLVGWLRRHEGLTR